MRSRIRKLAYVAAVAAGIAAAGGGCRGGSDRRESSGCRSCGHRPIPAIVQTVYEETTYEETTDQVRAGLLTGASAGRAALQSPTPVPAGGLRTCPVSGAAPGLLGPPVLATAAGKDIQVCRPGCPQMVLRDPETYLARVDRELGGVR